MKRRTFLLLLLVFLMGCAPAFSSQVRFQGIGINVKQTGAGKYKVTGVFRGSPAFGRLKRGDVIKEINGKPASLFSPAQAVRKFQSKVGARLIIKFTRGGKTSVTALSTTSYPVAANTIPPPPGRIPLLKILDFQSSEYFQAGVGGNGSLFKGDAFFILQDKRVIGLARVSMVNRKRVSMKIYKTYERIYPEKSGSYYLKYYRYLPRMLRIEKTPPRAKPGKGGKLSVIIRSYKLLISNKRSVMCVAMVRNTGGVVAKRIDVHCSFYDQNNRLISKKFGYVMDLAPGQQIDLEFVSKLYVPNSYDVKINRGRMKIQRIVSNYNIKQTWKEITVTFNVKVLGKNGKVLTKKF